MSGDSARHPFANEGMRATGINHSHGGIIIIIIIIIIINTPVFSLP